MSQEDVRAEFIEDTESREQTFGKGKGNFAWGLGYTEDCGPVHVISQESKKKTSSGDLYKSLMLWSQESW